MSQLDVFNVIMLQTRHNIYLYLNTDSSLWYVDKTMTVKLDCNRWTITHYIGRKLLHYKQIQKNQSYFFTLRICGKRNQSRFKIVETPKYFYNLQN